MPLAATGFAPSVQPMAGAMFIVGSSVLFGSGSLGDGPVPSMTCKRAVSPQAASPAASAITKSSWDVRIADLPYE
ncbi:hypothetical protein D9M71_792380 [compost metagenome]